MKYNIRVAEKKDLRAVAYIHVDSWRETYPGIVSRDVLCKLSYGKSYENWKFRYERTSQNIYIAEVENQVAGFAAGGPCRDEELLYEGEIYGMYILGKFQKIGIGKDFMIRFAEDFKRKKWLYFIIWALKKNDACRFYEKMGGELKETKQMTIGSKNLDVNGYVYDTEIFLKKFTTD